MFICGGAFAGLDKIISNRIGRKGIGFSADLRGEREVEVGEILEQGLPEDLLKFGLIPEFVGRLPVISTVHSLSEADLVRILTEPKNALVRQYKKFFSFDGVELHFTPEALKSVSRRAITRASGARGLRAILETVLLNVMYELPSRSDITKCVITKETIEQSLEPTLLTSGLGKTEEQAEESA